MKLFTQLIRAIGRAFVRIVLLALFCGLLAGAVALLVAYEGTRRWPPDQLTWVAVVVIVMLVVYAVAITIMLGEALRAAVRAADGGDGHAAHGAAAHADTHVPPPAERPILPPLPHDTKTRAT